tara:strand:+ start:130 stop:411 length:282 start_codon:yes stop_codon:yes gene_type:complete
MVDILALVLHHVMPEACFQHDEQAVLVAVEMALAEGVATKTHVLNLLHRLIDGKTIGGPDMVLLHYLRASDARRWIWDYAASSNKLTTNSISL